MKHPNQLNYNSEIAKVVREYAPHVTEKEILSMIQKYADAPSTRATFMKYYGEDWYGARSKITKDIGSKVVNQALNGDPESPTTYKSQEFYLRTKGQWTPKTIEETREIGTEEEEAESAVDALMSLLGKDTPEDETNG